MSTISLKKWGNSVGIRIPQALLKEADLEAGATLELSLTDNGALLLTPARNQQQGWLEQFNAVADSIEDEEILNVSNQFDEDDWTW